ncbi:MAG: protoporphyrinogen oxidase HemJ [Pseudomonadales bacterium]
MLWIKAFHIIFVVCWFAGIFYLPRLFVYHAMNEDSAVRAQLSVMEGKLYRFTSMNAVLTVALGVAAFAMNTEYFLASAWFHAKMIGVILLIAYHLMCGHMVKQLAAGENIRSHIFYRWFNEAPVFLLLAIVILVVVRPF